MAITLVNTGTGGDQLGGQATVSLGTAVNGGTATAANLLVFCVGTRDDFEIPTPAGWTPHPTATRAAGASDDLVGMFYKVAAGTETGVLLEATGGGWIGGISEWSGVATLDTHAESLGTTNPMIGGTVTPTAGVEALVIGAFVVETNDVFGWGGTAATGWTELHDSMVVTGKHPLLWAAYQAAGTTSGSYTPAGTLTPSGTGPYGSQVLVFTGGSANPAPPGVGIEFNGDEYID